MYRFLLNWLQRGRQLYIYIYDDSIVNLFLSISDLYLESSWLQDILVFLLLFQYPDGSKVFDIGLRTIVCSLISIMTTSKIRITSFRFSRIWFAILNVCFNENKKNSIKKKFSRTRARLFKKQRTRTIFLFLPRLSKKSYFCKLKVLEKILRGFICANLTF